MTQFSYTVKLKKTVLASLLGLGLTQSCFALEALTDESLSESTGEGIAFLPQNVKMVFQAANDGLVDAKADWANRDKDTGLIRIIPVGPLTTVAANAGAKKADIFLYGLALSRNDNNVTTRFSNVGVDSGTESNPWVMSVETQSIPNFAGVSKPLSYLQLEAPLAQVGLQPTNDKTIKLGLWGDVFARDQTLASNPINPATGAPSPVTNPNTNAANPLKEKLRFQMIANGLLLEGSQMRIFQTLDGATTGTGGLSASYNNTLGLGLLLRLNTHLNSDGGGTSADKVLRISTREKTGTTKDLTTPAIDGGLAPGFEDTEGLYMYSPNINLVLGNIYQPLIIDTPDGKNLTLEVTRIPNQASVYKNIYTDYSGSDTSYKGSTCNVRSCGDVRTIAGTSYQGTNATHSSISIGKVGFDAANKNLSITDKSTSATGVLMRGPSGDVNLGSAAIDGLLIQHFKITTTGL
ncbi:MULTISPECIES: hypothetical protein [unclassified Acinetobacter]|uniref:hypothetical protein n=1 Tax=unclassified Acinetobacter TaxID=196816 RepID=UPI002577203A|nr:MULTISPECIES: hypothetical protein [unclassified Acinetobacter]MDM1762839.1 hypothetical protein [Acinetobacter sp. 226-1]MDM1766318.1 hypothetical protein [Acinetobacter sp. 226-4]